MSPRKRIARLRRLQGQAETRIGRIHRRYPERRMPEAVAAERRRLAEFHGECGEQIAAIERGTA